MNEINIRISLNTYNILNYNDDEIQYHFLASFELLLIWTKSNFRLPLSLFINQKDDGIYYTTAVFFAFPANASYWTFLRGKLRDNNINRMSESAMSWEIRCPIHHLDGFDNYCQQINNILHTLEWRRRMYFNSQCEFLLLEWNSYYICKPIEIIFSIEMKLQLLS